MLKINKPLRRYVKLILNGVKQEVSLTYERLPIFCYICGMLGHSERECEKRHDGSEDGEIHRGYGPSLRSSVPVVGKTKEKKPEQNSEEWHNRNKGGKEYQGRWEEEEESRGNESGVQERRNVLGKENIKPGNQRTNIMLDLSLGSESYEMEPREVSEKRGICIAQSDRNQGEEQNTQNNPHIHSPFLIPVPISLQKPLLPRNVNKPAKDDNQAILATKKIERTRKSYKPVGKQKKSITKNLDNTNKKAEAEEGKENESYQNQLQMIITQNKLTTSQNSEPLQDITNERVREEKGGEEEVVKKRKGVFREEMVVESKKMRGEGVLWKVDGEDVKVNMLRPGGCLSHTFQ